MKTEKLISILKKYPGRDVLVHDVAEETFYDLEPEDVSLAFADDSDSQGAHDVVILFEDSDEEDTDDLNKVVVLWKS